MPLDPRETEYHPHWDHCCNCGRTIEPGDEMTALDDTQAVCSDTCLREYVMTEKEYRLHMSREAR